MSEPMLVIYAFICYTQAKDLQPKAASGVLKTLDWVRSGVQDQP